MEVNGVLNYRLGYMLCYVPVGTRSMMCASWGSCGCNVVSEFSVAAVMNSIGVWVKLTWG